MLFIGLFAVCLPSVVQRGCRGRSPRIKECQGGGVGGAFPQAAPRINAALAAFMCRNQILRVWVYLRVAAAL